MIKLSSPIAWVDIFGKIALISMLGLWVALSFSPALSEIFLWVGFGFWILTLILGRIKLVLPDRTTLILIGLFFATVIISMTVSDHPKQSFRGLFKLIRHFLIFLMVFNIFGNKVAFERWRNVMLIAFFILIINAGVQFFMGVDALRGFYSHPSSSGVRISGSFESYGKMAAYLCVVLPIVLFSTLNSFRIPRLRAELLLWLPLSVLGFFLLFATRSRGGFLAFFIGLALLLILRRCWKLLGVITFLAVIFISTLPASMIIHLDVDNKEQSLAERFQLWQRAADVIRARPLTGTGINTYAVAHQRFDTQKSWRVPNYYAHNGYLQMAAEIGVPGLIFFLFFLGRWMGLHRPRNSPEPDQEIRWGLLGGLLSFLIFCIADTALHSPQPVMTFWYAAGLLGASSHSYKKLI